jgi:hypothetical protein
MPSLVNTSIGANYRRAFAPVTNFGTRVLAFYQVTLDLSYGTLTDEEGGDNNQNPYFYPENPNEYDRAGYFQKAVQAIQQNAEVFGVFRPGDGRGDSDGNSFMVMISADNSSTGNENLDTEAGYNDMAQSIADAVYNSLDVGCDVYHMRIRGGETRYTDLQGLSVADKASAKVASARRPG